MSKPQRTSWLQKYQSSKLYKIDKTNRFSEEIRIANPQFTIVSQGWEKFADKTWGKLESAAFPRGAMNFNRKKKTDQGL